jgi:hypothetical protein
MVSASDLASSRHSHSNRWITLSEQPRATEGLPAWLCRVDNRIDGAVGWQ